MSINTQKKKQKEPKNRTEKNIFLTFMENKKPQHTHTHAHIDSHQNPNNLAVKCLSAYVCRLGLTITSTIAYISHFGFESV